MNKFKNKLIVIYQLLPFLYNSGKTFKKRFILAFALIGVSIATNVALPVILKFLVATFLHNDKTFISISSILLSYVVIWLFSQISMSLREFCMFRVVVRGMKSINIAVLECINHLSVRAFVENRTGAFLSKLDKMRDSFPIVFWGIFFYLVPTCIEIILATAVLWYFCGIIYGIILLCILGVFFSFTTIASLKLVTYQKASNEINNDFNAQLADNMLNFETIRFFGNQKYEFNFLNNIANKREAAEVKVLEYGGLINIIQGLIIGFGFMILTIITGYEVSKNRMSVSEFILVNGYILQFFGPLKYFGALLQNLRRSLTDLQQITDFLMQNYKIPNVPQLYRKYITAGEIIFDRVSFSYEPDRLILDNISFTIPAGTTLAIVGETGAGKSTVPKLLFRAYEPSSGKILIDGHNVNDFEHEDLLQQLSIIPQDPILFNRSIRDNIAYCNRDINQGKLINVIKYACLDNMIKKLPQGLSTLVGERGIKLSGGEKQRIAIARALYKNPKILIIDEGTSFLDFDTEAEILNSIKQLKMQNAQTLIIIAHRLSTVKNADIIIVLEHGKIVEIGNHKKLLNDGKKYSSLWKNSNTILSLDAIKG